MSATSEELGNGNITCRCNSCNNYNTKIPEINEGQESLADAYEKDVDCADRVIEFMCLQIVHNISVSMTVEYGGYIFEITKKEKVL